MPSLQIEILELIKERLQHPTTGARAGALLRRAPRGACRVQAAAQARSSVGWRPGADPRQPVRPAREGGPRRRPAPAPIPRASASSCPTTGRAWRERRTSTSRPPTSPKRCTAIACWCASSGRPSAGPKDASSASSSARHGTIVGRFETRSVRRRARGRPSTAASTTDVQVPSGRVVVGGTWRHGGRRDHPLAHRDPRRRRPRRRGARATINEPGVDTADHHPQARHP